VWQRWAQRILLGLSLALVCFLVYLLMTNSTASPPPTATAPGTINQADAIISKFTFTQTKGDKVQWQVDAQQARLYEQDKRAILDNVAVTLFGIQGKEMTVHGDEGTLNTDTKNFLLTNRSEPLVIYTQSGYTIYTQPSGLDGSNTGNPHAGPRPYHWARTGCERTRLAWSPRHGRIRST
jgi:lipopolysaccharide export system protein LptC